MNRSGAIESASSAVEHARLRLGVERQIAPLLDQRARQRLDEHALRQLELGRRARAFVAGLVARRQRQRRPRRRPTDDRRDPWWSGRRRCGCAPAAAPAGSPAHRRADAARGRRAGLVLLERESRLRADDAVIVLDLVGELQRAARLRLGILGERDRRRAIRDRGERAGHIVVEHAAQRRGAAIRDDEAMLLGAGGRRRRAFAARLGKAAVGRRLRAGSRRSRGSPARCRSARSGSARPDAARRRGCRAGSPAACRYRPAASPRHRRGNSSPAPRRPSRTPR